MSNSVDSNGGVHIWYIASSRRIYELYYNVSSNTWTNSDLTAKTGGTGTAKVGSPIIGYIDSVGNELFFIGGNGHIYQMHYNKQAASWIPVQDITQLTNARSPESNSYLTGFADSAGQHVYYTTVDGHVYQLYWNPRTNNWIYEDLTSKTGSLPAVAGTLLTSFGGLAPDSGIGEHVYYHVPYNGKRALGELYWTSSSGWRANTPVIALDFIDSPMASHYCSGDLQNGVCK